MNRTLTLAVVLTAVLPAFAAAEKKPVKTAKAPAAKAPAATAPVQTTEESPLAAAARRANRLGKKPVNVITNETLVKANTGHVTTTTNQRTLNLPQTAEAGSGFDASNLKAGEAKAKAEAAAQAKKEQEKRERKLQQLQEAAEDPYSELDPAQAEQRMQQTAAQADKPKKP